jgi:hypothetical protein
MMNLKEFVKFIKYETDLNRFFDTTTGYCITNRVLPTQYEVQKIKIALAVSDQIEGQRPQSLPSNLSGSISNCRIGLAFYQLTS